jgi:hypothetical protein
MYLLTENISESIKMYQDKQYAILEDVFNRECSFLDDRYKWEGFMDICKDIEAKDKELAAQAEALKKAEADKAKAEAESKAKDVEIERLKAELAKAQAKAKAQA